MTASSTGVGSSPIPTGTSMATKLNDGCCERAETMNTKHGLRFAVRCGSAACGPVISRRRGCPLASCRGWRARYRHSRNRREHFGNRNRTVVQLCSFVGNVLRSVHNTLGMSLCSSSALFPGCTCRRHHHRLLAAVPSLGPKPVACTGFLFWLSQEKSYVH